MPISSHWQERRKLKLRNQTGKRKNGPIGIGKGCFNNKDFDILSSLFNNLAHEMKQTQVVMHTFYGFAVHNQWK